MEDRLKQFLDQNASGKKFKKLEGGKEIKRSLTIKNLSKVMNVSKEILSEAVQYLVREGLIKFDRMVTPSSRTYYDEYMTYNRPRKKVEHPNKIK